MHIQEVDSLSEIKHAGQLGKAKILHDAVFMLTTNQTRLNREKKPA